MSLSSPSASTPDIPDKNWENPFQEGLFLHKIFGQVLREERDIVIIVDDIKARRGTGKTITSLQLARAMDQTDEGMSYKKTTLQPEKLRNAYTANPKKSALVFDEAEAESSKYQTGSKTNKALRKIMSMGRVEEKYVILNTPLRSFIDPELLKLANVWISMVRRGLALVHHLDWETYSETLLKEKKQWLHVDDIEKGTDLRNVYNKLHREKEAKLDGEDVEEFVPQDEHKKALERARKEAALEQRNEVLRSIMNDPAFRNSPVTQSEVANAVGLSQSQLSRIINNA